MVGAKQIDTIIAVKIEIILVKRLTFMLYFKIGETETTETPSTGHDCKLHCDRRLRVTSRRWIKFA